MELIPFAQSLSTSAEKLHQLVAEADTLAACGLIDRQLAEALKNEMIALASTLEGSSHRICPSAAVVPPRFENRGG